MKFLTRQLYKIKNFYIIQDFCIVKSFYTLMIPDKKKHLLIAFLAGLSMILYPILSAFLLKGLYSAITKSSTKLLFYYMTFYIGSLALFFLYNGFFWNLYGHSLALISAKIRGNIVGKLCSLSFIEVEKQHSNAILSLFTNDLKISEEIYINLRTFISLPLYFLIPIFLIFFVSKIFGMLIIFLSFLQLFINLLVIKPLHKQALKIRTDTDKLNMAYSDILHNNMIIRLYGSETYYTNLCEHINKNLYKEKIKLNCINALSEGANVFVALLGYIILLITGAAFISNGSLSLADLLFITQLRLMMVQGIFMFYNCISILPSTLVGLKRILNFMENPVAPDGINSIIK